MRPRTTTSYQSYRDRGRRAGPLRRLLVFVVAFALLYFLVHTLFLQSIVSDSRAMSPSIEPGDALLLSPLTYGPQIRLFNWTLPGISQPSRGDVVAVRPAFMPENRFLVRLANPIVRLFSLERVRLDDGDSWRGALQLKRVIGLPGDTLRMERFVVYIRSDGAEQFRSEFELSPREYETQTDGLPEGWRDSDPLSGTMEEVTLGPDDYFVMSDNRVEALDSRHWGAVSARALRGRVFLRYWPLRRVGTQ